MKEYKTGGSYSAYETEVHIKLEGRKSVRKIMCRWNNIKIFLKEIGQENVDLIHVETIHTSGRIL
jgi:hypothetical protein